MYSAEDIFLDFKNFVQEKNPIIILVHATEVNVIMWGRSVHLLSYVYAFCVSLIFTVLVNLMLKKSITKMIWLSRLKLKIKFFDFVIKKNCHSESLAECFDLVDTE